MNGNNFFIFPKVIKAHWQKKRKRKGKLSGHLFSFLGQQPGHLEKLIFLSVEFSSLIRILKYLEKLIISSIQISKQDIKKNQLLFNPPPPLRPPVWSLVQGTKD